MAYRYRARIRAEYDRDLIKPRFRVSPRVEVLRPKIVRARPKLDLRTIEDRRTFHPLGAKRPPATLSRRDQRRVIEKAKSIKQVYNNNPGNGWFPATATMQSLRLGFAVPKKVAICVRRKQRREAIFAHGKSGGGNRRPRRNATSWMEC